jgi:MFS family permease
MTRAAWGVLAVVTGALFLEGIDIAMLNVAVPSIAADIGLATGSAHWVISAYVLAYGGFMILGGRVADLMGRRRVFLVALTVFIAFSGIGGLAQDAWVLVLARFVTGATAGFMTPAGFSLLTTSFPEGSSRNRALAIYGAIGAAGFYSGVVAGGLLTTVSWRWVFFAPVVIGAVFLVLGRAFIRPDEETATPRSRDPRVGQLDLAGGLTLTLAMVTLIYGVVTVGEASDPTVGLGAFAAAAALVVAFVAIERRAVNPLLRLGLLARGLLPWTSIVGLLFFGSFFAWQFLLTLHLQDYFGWSALQTGLTFAAMSVELLIAPFLTPKLVERFGNLPVLIAGLLSVTLAFVLMLRLDGSWGFAELLPTLLLVGVAFALIYGPLTAAATEGLDDAEHGVAGGVVYTAFQFGAALGVSVATIVLLGDGHEAARTTDFQRGFLVPAAAAVAALLLAFATLARHRVITTQRVR